MRTLLLDVYNESVRLLDIEDELDQYYRFLECSTIDIVVRNIGGKEFDVVCDDEGLFHDPLKISLLDVNEMPCLVGNLIFLHHNDKGEMVGLDYKDIEHLWQNLGLNYTQQFPHGYPAMFNCIM